jgi:hypothetical protein
MLRRISVRFGGFAPKSGLMAFHPEVAGTAHKPDIRALTANDRKLPFGKSATSG